MNGDGTGWRMASWWAAQNGGQAHSNYLPVTPGDVLYGYVFGNSCNTTTGICASWTIYTQDNTAGTSVTLQNDAMGEAQDWSLGAVYEAYGVTSCSLHPSSGSITFTNITVANSGGDFSPPWTSTTYTNLYGPQCSISLHLNSETSQTISWCVPSVQCTPSTCGQQISDGCGDPVQCPPCACKLPNVECGCGLGCLNATICHRECP